MSKNDKNMSALLINTFRTAATHPDEHTAQTLLSNLQNHQPRPEPASNQMYTHQDRETLADESERLREETYADRDTHL